jgi:dolichol-phosphate mannosyltransferase
VPYLSVVSPVYGAEGVVLQLVERIEAALRPLGHSFEIVLVEDGSPDQSWKEMVQAAAACPEVVAIRLSRNFGQHRAITAGLEQARGAWVVVMDCDLQDKPEEIPAFLAKAQEGWDVVQGQRVFRRDSAIKRWLSTRFYAMMGMMTGSRHDHTIANFGLYRRNVVEAVLAMRESVRFFPLQVQWAGFRRTGIPVDHGEREVGETAYTFSKALNLAIDVLLSFSDKPLRLTIRAGVLVMGVAFLMAAWLMVRTLFYGITGEGWLSLMASIWFLSGLIIVVLGMTGLYIGKVFEEVKQRPIYLVAEVLQQDPASGELRSQHPHARSGSVRQAPGAATPAQDRET